jgi:hypothetical protein
MGFISWFAVIGILPSCISIGEGLIRHRRGGLLEDRGAAYLARAMIPE